MTKPTTTTARVKTISLGWLLFFILSSTSSVAFEFDRDTGTNCEEQAALDEWYCFNHLDLWKACPITCAKKYVPDQQSYGNIESNEAIYEWEVDTVQHGTLKFDQLDGMTIVILTVPMQLAPFHLALLQHLKDHVYEWGVEFLLIPTGDWHEDMPMPVSPKNKVMIHKHKADVYTPFVKFLYMNVRIAENGVYDPRIPTVFLFSPDGRISEMHASPDYFKLRQVIDFYYNAEEVPEL